MVTPLKDEFDARGYVRIDDALAPDGLGALRRRMDQAFVGCGPGATAKLGDDAEAAPLILSAPLRAAFDTLLGPGRWIEPEALEDLRVKFPAPGRPGRWHVDVFERGPQTTNEDLLSWRASPRCGGVGLLGLLLLSDVGPADRRPRCAPALTGPWPGASTPPAPTACRSANCWSSGSTPTRRTLPSP